MSKTLSSSATAAAATTTTKTTTLGRNGHAQEVPAQLQRNGSAFSTSSGAPADTAERHSEHSSRTGRKKMQSPLLPSQNFRQQQQQLQHSRVLFNSASTSSGIGLPNEERLKKNYENLLITVDEQEKQIYQLNELKQKMERERQHLQLVNHKQFQKAKSSSNTGIYNSVTGNTKTSKQVSGFSTWFVFFLAVAAFLIGVYLKRQPSS